MNATNILTNPKLNETQLWKKFIQDRQREIDGEKYVKEPRRGRTREEVILYILGQICEELLEIEDKFDEIPRLSYSSRGMNEQDKVKHLVEKTDNLVFPNGEQFLASHIYSEYNIDEHGVDGIYEILSNFVEWNDTNALTKEVA